MIPITQTADENSSYPIKLEFRDDNKALTIPDVIYWKLTDIDGNTINNRDWVSPTPASTIYIMLSKADLETYSSTDEYRILTVEYEYSSTLGDNIPMSYEYMFLVKNTKNKRSIV
jgi:hypothetical protein